MASSYISTLGFQTLHTHTTVSTSKSMDLIQPPTVAARLSSIPNTSTTTTTTTNSLSYHSQGKRLFAVQDSQFLQIIDSYQKGEIRATLKNPGMSMVQSTHHDECVLAAVHKTSPKSTTVVQYWSLRENKIMRQFRETTTDPSVVSSISLSPNADQFLTTTTGPSTNTVSLWDLSQAGCVAQCPLMMEPNNISTNNNNARLQHPVAAFDATGLVFAIAATGAATPPRQHYVHLYDARNYGAGPFGEFQFQLPPQPEHTIMSQQQQQQQNDDSNNYNFQSIEFNSKGDQIMLTTDNGMTILLDGYEGNLQQVYYHSTPATYASSSNSNTIWMAQNAQRTIDCIQCETTTSTSSIGAAEQQPLLSSKKLHSCESTGNITCLASNPAFGQFASSSGSEITLWRTNQQ